MLAFAVAVSFCFLLLGKVAFAVAHYSSHMTKIILLIPRWIFLGMLLQDLNDLAAATVCCEMKWSVLHFYSHLPFMTNGLARILRLFLPQLFF